MSFFAKGLGIGSIHCVILIQKSCANVYVYAADHGVESERFGEYIPAGQTVCLAVTLSKIAQTEQQQSHCGLHPFTVTCTWTTTEEKDIKINHYYQYITYLIFVS